MYLENKYVTIFTGEPYVEYGPCVYIDICKLSPNLKHNWRSNHEIHFSLGIYNFHLRVIISWGFVERKRTIKEEETYKRAQRFCKEINR